MLDLLYLCDKSRRFVALAVKNIGASFVFLARLLYLCKTMCGGGYEVIDRRNN